MFDKISIRQIIDSVVSSFLEGGPGSGPRPLNNMSPDERRATLAGIAHRRTLAKTEEKQGRRKKILQRSRIAYLVKQQNEALGESK